jgi:hypothetical protein
MRLQKRRLKHRGDSSTEVTAAQHGVGGPKKSWWCKFTLQIKGLLVDTDKKNADGHNHSVTHTSLFLFSSTFLFPKYFHSNMFFGDIIPLHRVDTLKRPIATVLPSITTAHHDGGLPFPLSYTLADNDPPLPSIPTQHSRQNLRDRCLF